MLTNNTVCQQTPSQSMHHANSLFQQQDQLVCDVNQQLFDKINILMIKLQQREDQGKLQ